MKFVILIISILNILMIFMVHPVSMMALIFIQSVTISILLFLLNSNPWIALILFLIFVGGLMILFLYISSLASNEKFKIKMKKLTKFSSLTLSMGLVWMIMTKKFETEMIPSVCNSLSNIFYNSSILTVTSVMVYLFLIMVAVTAITSQTKSPILFTYSFLQLSMWMPQTP